MTDNIEVVGNAPVTKTPDIITALVVDADIVAYRCSATCQESDIDTLHNTLDGFINNMMIRTGIRTLMMCISDSTNFRYQIAKTKPYKGNRVGVERPKYLIPAKEYIVDNYNGFSIDNMEADDVIASAITKFPYSAHAGVDKDIRQVVGWHYNFVKLHWEYTSPEESKLMLNRQVCMGDSQDNIPGLPRIGKVKAAKAVTDPDTAHLQALELYLDVMFDHIELLDHFSGSEDEKIAQYFVEQTALVSMMCDLDIQDKYFKTYSPDLLVTPQEGDFDGFDETEVDYK